MESLKVVSETYKVSQYDEEEESIVRRELGAVGEQGCWQSWLPSLQIWPSQVRKLGQHNPSIDIFWRAFLILQERHLRTVRESRRLHSTTTITSLDKHFLCVSKECGKPRTLDCSFLTELCQDKLKGLFAWVSHQLESILKSLFCFMWAMVAL